MFNLKNLKTLTLVVFILFNASNSKLVASAVQFMIKVETPSNLRKADQVFENAFNTGQTKTRELTLEYSQGLDTHILKGTNSEGEFAFPVPIKAIRLSLNLNDPSFNFGVLNLNEKQANDLINHEMYVNERCFGKSNFASAGKLTLQNLSTFKKQGVDMTPVSGKYDLYLATANIDIAFGFCDEEEYNDSWGVVAESLASSIPENQLFRMSLGEDGNEKTVLQIRIVENPEQLAKLLI